MGSMQEGETFKQLQVRIEQLERENELLKANRDTNDKGKPGQKLGHKGVTRPFVAPDRQVELTMDRCPDCGAELGSPLRCPLRHFL